MRNIEVNHEAARFCMGRGADPSGGSRGVVVVVGGGVCLW